MGGGLPIAGGGCTSPTGSCKNITLARTVKNTKSMCRRVSSSLPYFVLAIRNKLCTCLFTSQFTFN